MYEQRKITHLESSGGPQADKESRSLQTDRKPNILGNEGGERQESYAS